MADKTQAPANFDVLVEALARDERVLSGGEQALLSTILRSALGQRSGSRELDTAIAERLAQAIGEAVVQRVLGTIGGAIAQQVFAPQLVLPAAPIATPPPDPQPPPPNIPPPPPNTPSPGPDDVGPRDPPPPPPPSPDPPGTPSSVDPGAGVLAFVIVEDLLQGAALAELVRFAVASEDRLGAAGEGHASSGRPAARTLIGIGRSEEAVLRRLSALVPRAAAALRVPPFEPTRFDVRVTVADDGHDFPLVEREHARISFVYPLWRSREVARSSHVRVREPGVARGHGADHARIAHVHPGHAVLFPSALAHEILPLERGSRSFADRRFLLHGWLGR